MLDTTCDTHDTPTSVLSTYPCFMLFSVGLGRVEQKPSCQTHMKLVFQLLLQNPEGCVFTVAIFCLFFMSFFFFFDAKTIELAVKTAEKCCCEHPYLW